MPPRSAVLRVSRPELPQHPEFAASVLLVTSNVQRPERTELLRYVLAGGVLIVGTALASASASGFAYSSDQGAGRLRELAPALAASVLVGAFTVAVVRVLLGFRLLSGWLLLGAVPAFALALNHVGVIG